MKPFDEQALERVVAKVLLGGLWLSVTLIGLGLLESLGLHQPLPQRVVPWGQLLQRAFEPAGALSLGLIALLLTPLLRVAFSIVAFALQRDWRYVLLTGTVMAILLLSLFLGHGG